MNEEKQVDKKGSTHYFKYNIRNIQSKKVKKVYKMVNFI